MTLSLYVLRHAKAAPAGVGSTEGGSPLGADHARPLKRRGRRAARAAGRLLAALDETPERVLCSSALRARETAEQLLEAAGSTLEPELHAALYEATPTTLLGLLSASRAPRPPVQRVLLVGHQPALSLLIAALTGSEPLFPPGALARIDLELDGWEQLGTGRGQLAWLVPPSVAAAREQPPAARSE